MTYESVAHVLGLCVVVFPALLLALLGLTSLVDRPLREQTISRATQISVVVGLICSILVLFIMLASGKRNIQIELGDWVVIHELDFHFHLKFVFDRLSVPFAKSNRTRRKSLAPFLDWPEANAMDFPSEEN